MLIVMRKGATDADLKAVVSKIESMGCQAREMPGGERVAIGVLHNKGTLDLSAAPVVRRESHLPIIADPSHAGGHRNQVLPLARAAAAVGVDGLMIEVHNQPEKALSDGGQSLYPEQFEDLVRQVTAIYSLRKGQPAD
jgi:3-deoxy-D-manno-octulosonic acid (KDO) 8-phosphate synthase